MALAIGVVFSAGGASPALASDDPAPKRVTITGGIIDSWCYLSEIMWATGSAHPYQKFAIEPQPDRRPCVKGNGRLGALKSRVIRGHPLEPFEDITV